MDFKITLQGGKAVEKMFVSKMLEKGIDVQKIEFAPDEVFKDWDVKLTNKDKVKTYEVKRDFKSQETGNIALEFRCNGFPSGIFASKADYIVFCTDEGEFYYQNRGELLYRLSNCDKKIVSGGDGDRAEMYLISKGKINELFVKL